MINDEKNCLNIQYKLLNGLFFDNKIETDNYILCSSKIMDDYYWNLAYIKGTINDLSLNDIENKLRSMNRQCSLYIGVNDDYEYNKEFVLNKGYSLNDSDVYMKLDNRHDIDINIDIRIVKTEEEYNDFMKVLSSAYNDTNEKSDENVYAGAITECYYETIKNTINNKDHMHVVAYSNNIPVSVATFNYVNGIGSINSVGTAQGYWNMGYGKQVISFIINKFEELGGNSLILNTEYNSKNQKFYEKLGFKEMYVIKQFIKLS